jgi:hydrogenase maturation protease
VIERLRGTLPDEVALLEREGEPTALIDSWLGAERLWLVDAVRSGAPAGTLHRLEVDEQGLPAELFRTSTHHFGLAEAVELARTLGRLPEHMVVFGIEAERLEVGEEITRAVAAAVERAAAAVREEVLACTSKR